MERGCAKVSGLFNPTGEKQSCTIWLAENTNVYCENWSCDLTKSWMPKYLISNRACACSTCACTDMTQVLTSVLFSFFPTTMKPCSPCPNMVQPLIQDDEFTSRLFFFVCIFIYRGWIIAAALQNLSGHLSQSAAVLAGQLVLIPDGIQRIDTSARHEACLTCMAV